MTGESLRVVAVRRCTCPRCHRAAEPSMVAELRPRCAVCQAAGCLASAPRCDGPRRPNGGPPWAA